MRKIIELNVDKVLDYYSFEPYYSLKNGKLNMEYDIDKKLNEYVKELIEEKEGFECDFEINNYCSSNGFIYIEYNTKGEK